MEDIYVPEGQKPESSEISARQFKKPSVAAVGLLFSTIMLILITVGTRVQRGEGSLGILITEFVLILLPAIIFLIIFKYDLKKMLRLNKARVLTFFIVFWLMVFSMLTANSINTLYMIAVKAIFGHIIIPNVPVATDPSSLLLYIFVIGVSPAICEEILFRGVIQRGFERFGAVLSIMITAVLFGMFHLYFERFLGTFLLGIVISFIAYRTNSIYCSMFAHFVNNSIGVIVGYITYLHDPSSINPEKTAEVFNSYFTMPTMQLVALIIGIVFWIVIFGGIVTALIVALVKVTKGIDIRLDREKGGVGLKAVAGFIPGFLLIGIMYIYEGLRLKQINPGILGEVLKRITGG